MLKSELIPIFNDYYTNNLNIKEYLDNNNIFIDYILNIVLNENIKTVYIANCSNLYYKKLIIEIFKKYPHIIIIVPIFIDKHNMCLYWLDKNSNIIWDKSNITFRNLGLWSSRKIDIVILYIHFFDSKGYFEADDVFYDKINYSNIIGLCHFNKVDEILEPDNIKLDICVTPRENYSFFYNH